MFPNISDLKHVALVMVDFQRDFCSDGGYASRSFGTGWVEKILDPASELLDASRKAGLTIIHTREGYAPDLSDLDPWKQRKASRVGAPIGDQGPLGRFLIRGEYGHDFIDDLKPLPGEKIVDKNTYGAFLGTDLHDFLKTRDIEHLLIAGVTADVCVHTTLREAVDRGFDCYYVADAIAAFDRDTERACERMVEQEGGVWGAVVTVAEVCRDLLRIPMATNFVEVGGDA